MAMKRYYISETDERYETFKRTGIGEFGLMREKFLMENYRPAYSKLVLSGDTTLWAYLWQAHRDAMEYIKNRTQELKTEFSVTEALKSQDQLLWIQKMNQIRHIAREEAIALIVEAPPM